MVASSARRTKTTNKMAAGFVEQFSARSSGLRALGLVAAGSGKERQPTRYVVLCVGGGSGDGSSSEKEAARIGATPSRRGARQRQTRLRGGGQGIIEGAGSIIVRGGRCGALLRWLVHGGALLLGPSSASCSTPWLPLTIIYNFKMLLLH
uniref:Uncharacterized protein n=1 Tax=Oryza sativa subsp. japonica TaxID=39947 RepID=Q7Y158_ORYSJ|nr:hypothetical protein [Oryza sativa Japonica Group]